MAPPPAIMASGLASSPAAAGIAIALIRIVGAAAADFAQHDRPAALGADERHDFCDLGYTAQLCFDLVNARREFALAFEQQRISALDGTDAIPGHAPPPHPDDVDADQTPDRMQHETERDHIIAERGVARDHRALADAGELMHGAMPADEHVVPHFDVPAKHGVVGEDDVLADLAVVPDMRAYHQKAVVSDNRVAAAALSADIDGHALADLTARTDRQPRWLAAIMHRLGRRTERGERINRATRPDRRMPREVHVCDEPAVFADGDMRP